MFIFISFYKGKLQLFTAVNVHYCGDGVCDWLSLGLQGHVSSPIYHRCPSVPHFRYCEDNSLIVFPHDTILRLLNAPIEGSSITSWVMTRIIIVYVYRMKTSWMTWRTHFIFPLKFWERHPLKRTDLSLNKIHIFRFPTKIMLRSLSSLIILFQLLTKPSDTKSSKNL